MKIHYLFMYLCFFCIPLCASADKKIDAESPAIVTIINSKTEYSVVLPNGYKYEVVDGKQVKPPSSHVPFIYVKPDADYARAQTVLSLARWQRVSKKEDKTTWNVFADNRVE